MQIKRFEAPDVPTALNRVKQAFGPEAVILSVRNFKRDGGLLGVLNKAGVEVTAAIDPQKGEASDLSPAAEVTVVRAAAVGAFAGGVRPAAVVGDLAHRRKGPVMVSSSGSVQALREAASRLRRAMAAHGVRDSLVSELMRRMPAPDGISDQTPENWLISALAPLIEAKGICAPVSLRPGPETRVIALVGPTGVGKTTAAARIAAQHNDVFDGRIGLISCDDRKIAAEAEIERYGRIIGVPVACAWTVEALRAAMDRMADRSLVIIDTPGLSPSDGQALQALKEMLDLAGAEIHLLLSAAAKPADLEKTLDRFSPLDIQRLVITRLDETDGIGALLNLPTGRRIPLSWVTFGPQIPEALRPASGQNLARLLIDADRAIDDWRSQAVWVVATTASPPPGAAVARPGDRPAVHAGALRYVANRNSDIFHRSTCKWTRMIKAENMITFDSVEAAEAQKFHGCRTCCPKPGQRTINRSAMVVGQL